MKNKEFKLLIENFNKFLLKEHIKHDADDVRLLAAIPKEFSDYINDQMLWFNGESWILETDHGSDQDGEDDQRHLFEEVARACGCQVKDLLVNFDDSYREDMIDDSGDDISADDFLDSYRDGSGLCGSFDMNGASLKGFYFRLGTNAASYGLQFKSMMSERTLKGLIFVAPDCSGSSAILKPEPEPLFRSKKGSMWSSR
tara:strand:- start:224 stop:820 length:597 start_codon:yes stop_codon:yes gene_type:complete